LGSTRRSKELVPLFKELGVGTVGLLARKDQQFVSVEFLDAVLEHWTIDLIKDVTTDLDHQIGSYASDIAVEHSVMEFAQSESVRGEGLTLWVGVGKDVGGVQQLGMAQSAHGA
jgi:hypothetical protein